MKIVKIFFFLNVLNKLFANNPALDSTPQTPIKQENIKYRYNIHHPRDPFIPPLPQGVSEIKGKEKPLTNFLQMHHLSDFLVSGIWKAEGGQRKALIMTPTSEGIIIDTGTIIGLNQGKVIAIEENYVRIREYAQSIDGIKEFEDFDLILGEAGATRVRQGRDIQKESEEKLKPVSPLPGQKFP